MFAASSWPPARARFPWRARSRDSAGYRIAGGATRPFGRAGRAGSAGGRSESLAPLHQMIEVLDEELARGRTLCGPDRGRPGRPTTDHLPSIGPITATRCSWPPWMTSTDSTGRRGAAQVASYLGLVPRVQLRRTTATGPCDAQRPPVCPSLIGPSRLAGLPVDRPAHRRASHWAQAIAARRGKNIAIVALARRLARILYAMWRDGVDYRRTDSHATQVAEQTRR